MSQEVNGKAFAGALGVASLLLVLAGALIGLHGVPVDWTTLICLALLGLSLDLASNPLSQTGFISLSFVAALFALARPAEVLPSHEALGPLPTLGQAILVCAVALLPRLANWAQSWTHVLACYGLNLVRLTVLGLAYLGIRGTESASLKTVIAALVATLIFWVYEVVITNVVAESVHDNQNRRIWRTIKSKAAQLLSLQVPIAVLAAGFAQALAPVLPGWLACVAAAVLGGSLTLSIRSALLYAQDELVVQDQEALEMQVRQVNHKNKTLSEDNDVLKEDLKAKDQELNLIYEMAKELGASTNLSETLGIVRKMITRHRIPYQSCVVFLAKEGGGLYQALADTPYKEVLEMSPLLQLQEQLITQVLQEGRPQMVTEMNASSEQRIFKDERSVICVPLTVSKEIVGVIYLGSIKAGTHKEEHLEKLKMLAAYAAPSIKTAVLFENKEQDLRSERQIREAVEAQKRQLEGLQRMGQEIGKTLKMANTLQIVTENLQQMIPKAQSVIIFTVKDDNVTLQTERAVSPYGDFVKTLPVRKDEGLLGKCMELRSTMLVKDTNVYDLQNIIAYERSVIVAPLVAEEDVMGCLYVGASKENVFTEEQKSLVETVSFSAALAIKNAKLYEQTQEMALTDGLTGLSTHRHFQVRLSEEIEWSERSGKPICLVMVDTDHFKTFNDTLGHPAGDSLLKDIAALLKDKVRSTDIVCRYGGDEFALILRDAPKDQAAITCERIRESFQLRFAAFAVQVTSSIGMACFPIDARNKKDLAKAADDAMYVSKRNGRNRVSVAPSLEERARPGYEEIKQEVLPR